MSEKVIAKFQISPHSDPFNIAVKCTSRVIFEKALKGHSRYLCIMSLLLEIPLHTRSNKWLPNMLWPSLCYTLPLNFGLTPDLPFSLVYQVRQVFLSFTPYQFFLIFETHRHAKRDSKEYNFYPRTWVLPQEYNVFLTYAKKNSHPAYIVKPANGAMGMG